MYDLFLPLRRMASAFLNNKGYHISLQSVNFLTLNSPDSADASLNILYYCYFNIDILFDFQSAIKKFFPCFIFVVAAGCSAT